MEKTKEDYRHEMARLMEFYEEYMDEKALLTEDDASEGCSEGLVYGCLMEERSVPLSILAEEIQGKLSRDDETVSFASVKHKIQLYGLRNSYGLRNLESDLYEDTTEATLWCWETRNLDHLPESHRGSLTIRRHCRTKIQERILAVSKMIEALHGDQPKGDMDALLALLAKAPEEFKIRQMMEKSIRKLEDKASREAIKKKKREEEMEERIVEKQNSLLESERSRLKKESERKIARFLEIEKKKVEKIRKHRMRVSEELKKLERELIDQQERIKKEKEEMEMKFDQEIEALLEQWLKNHKAKSNAKEVPLRQPVIEHDIIPYEAHEIETTSPVAVAKSVGSSEIDLSGGTGDNDDDDGNRGSGQGEAQPCHDNAGLDSGNLGKSIMMDKVYYEKVSKALVMRLRQENTVTRDGLAGMRQRDLIEQYVDVQNASSKYSSLEEAAKETDNIKAIIERLIERDDILITLTDGKESAEGEEELSARDRRILAVSPSCPY